MDVIDAVATRVAVNRAKSRLTGRFAGAVTPVSGTVIGEGLALVNGQLVNAAVSESQIGETLSLQNAGRAAAAVYVPTAGAGGVASASSGGGGVVSVPAGGLIAHDLGGDFHIGQLRSDQAEWALMVDGSRMLMGDMDVYAGVLIDGVDLDVHAGDPAAHHDPVTVGVGLALSVQQVSLASSVAGAGLGFNAGVLNVGAGTLLTVGADSVGITAGSNYQFIGTGSGTVAAWRDLSSLAGDGLTHSVGVLAVGVANTGAVGLSVEADTVRLTSSNNPGAEAKVLASDASGWTTLVGLSATERVRTPIVDTASGDLTLSPADDLMLSPASNLVKLPSGKMLQSDGYQSQAQGMRITAGGSGDFRYLYADELHAKSFITDLEQALAGGQIISKSVAVVAADFTLPASGFVYVTFKDFPSALGMQVFQLNDWVAFRTFRRQNNQLEVGWAWGQVTEPVDNQNGTQTWKWTRNAGTPGLASGTIAADSIALDFGMSGNGFYEVNAIDGQYAENSPYWRIVTWASHPATQTVRVQGGNLRGLFGQVNEYGFYAGDGVTDTSKYLRLSSVTNEFRNLTARWYEGSVESLKIDAQYGLGIQADSVTSAPDSINSVSWYRTLSTRSTAIGWIGAYNVNNNVDEMSLWAGNGAVSDVGRLILNANSKNGNPSVRVTSAPAVNGGSTVELWVPDGSVNIVGSSNSSLTFQVGAAGSKVQVWHAGNDGATSGLDADKLDGEQGSYYLAASSYTAADVLTKLKTVDGHNSLLDACRLDGQESSFYLAASSYTAADVLAKLKTVDGHNSGTDADTLDTYHAASFALLSGAAFTGLVSTTNHIRAGSTGLTDVGAVSATNWFRSKGSTGWYSQDYGGGIYMIDSTWVRTYGSKGFYCNSTIQSEYLLVGNNTSALGAWTNLSVSTGWANYGGSYAPARYRRFGDVVHLQMMVTCTNASYGGILNIPYQIAYRHIYEPPSSVQHCRVDAVPYSGYTSIQTVGGQVLNQWIMLDAIIPIY